MWLINTHTLKLEHFHDCPVGTYAILSHTWEIEELDFAEFQAGGGYQKVGFQKVRMCCEQARRDGLHYAWVDTCCIDKRSSSELSEAINSMFNWYSYASICYAYLADVYNHSDGNDDYLDTFSHSRWFTRGWTLQELLAPKNVEFYSRYWDLIGTKLSLCKELVAATGIEEGAILTPDLISYRSVADKMSWASRRRTTRVEDSAYCLLGLFGVNMPLLYGEGSRAFIRLQETIIQQNDDESIFAWTGVPEEGSGLLAPNPACFSDSNDISAMKIPFRLPRPPFACTNRGLAIRCQMLPCGMNTYVVPLHCARRGVKDDKRTYEDLAIFICRTTQYDQFRRVNFRGECVSRVSDWFSWKIAQMSGHEETLTENDSRAKIADIFVPHHNSEKLVLSPRGGIPFVEINSNLYIWHSRGIDDRASGLPRNNLNLRASRNAMGEMTVDKGAGSSLRSPKKAETIHFRPQDLERGLVLALSRSNILKARCQYYLEIGFDTDFRPVCILHHIPFWLAQLRLLMNKGRFKLSPVQNLIWTGSTEGVQDVSFLRRSFYEHRTIKSAPHSKLGLVWAEERTIFSTRTLFTPFTWITKGNRSGGLDLRISHGKASCKGCTRIYLKFQPKHDSEWRLDIQEDLLHDGEREREESSRENHPEDLMIVMFDVLLIIMAAKVGGPFVWLTCGCTVIFSLKFLDTVSVKRALCLLQEPFPYS